MKKENAVIARAFGSLFLKHCYLRKEYYVLCLKKCWRPLCAVCEVLVIWIGMSTLLEEHTAPLHRNSLKPCAQ